MLYDGVIVFCYCFEGFLDEYVDKKEECYDVVENDFCDVKWYDECGVNVEFRVELRFGDIDDDVI